MSTVLDSQGSKAVRNGAEFEKISGLNFNKLHPKYRVRMMYEKDKGYYIFQGKDIICESHPKKQFKAYFHTNTISYQMDMPNMEPDNCIINWKTKTIYIIEIKFQHKEGSVDEKPQAYIFRQRYFNDLLKSMGMKVKLIYVFNDWFRQNKYNYLRRNMDIDGVDYYYNELPPSAIGLDENPFGVVVVHNNVQTDELTLW